MPIQVTCGQGHKLNVPDNLAGRKVRCPRCQQVVGVPQEQVTLPQAPAPTKRREAPAAKGGGGWKWVLLLGGGLGVVLAAAVVGYLVWGGKKAGPEPAADREAIREVARRFADAAGDDSAFLALLTDKARGRMAKEGTPKREGWKQRPGVVVHVGEPTVTGDTAQVQVSKREAGKEDRIVLNLRRQGTDWRIRGLELEIAPGKTLPMNFEEPQEMAKAIFPEMENFGKEMEKTLNKGVEDSMTGQPTAEDRANEALKPLDRAAFEATWKGDLAVKDRPAGVVLRELARAFGFKLEATPAQEQALGANITLRLDGRSRYERLEAVCRQAGFYPEYADAFASMGGQPLVRLKQLPRPYPVAFAGPFLVELAELKEYVPYATGVVGLRVLASGLPPTVAGLLDKGMSPFAVTEVVDAKGRDLHDRSRLETGRVWRIIAGGYDRTFDVPLKNLLRDVTAIKSLRGKVRLPLPSRLETLRFEPPKVNAVQKAGGVEVRLTRLTRQEMNFNGKKYPQQSVSLSFTGAGPDQIRVIAYDAQKKLRAVSRLMMGGSDKQGNAQYTIAGEVPAVLVVKVLGTEQVDCEFRLDDVALASAAQMPEKLTPASFAGHAAPVSVEFVAVKKDQFLARAQLRVTNHADQPIRSLTLKLDYLDKAGKRVGGWPSLDHGAPVKPEEKGLALLVGKNATATIEVQAPFLPGNAATVQATVSKVTFADATEWKGGK